MCDDRQIEMPLFPAAGEFWILWNTAEAIPKKAIAHSGLLYRSLEVVLVELRQPAAWLAPHVDHHLDRVRRQLAYKRREFDDAVTDGVEDHAVTAICASINSRSSRRWHCASSLHMHMTVTVSLRDSSASR